jgi:hypothetical protein
MRNCTHSRVPSAISKDSHGELLSRVTEISLLCQQIEAAVESLVEYHGEQAEAAASARDLQASVCELKSRVLQHYLECCIEEAARAEETAAS